MCASPWRFWFAFALALWIGFYSQTAYAQPDPAELAKAVAEIEYLETMRSELASTLEDRVEAPTAQTFQEVCKPVGMKARQLGQDNGWVVKQIASKYRNPAHAPDTSGSEAALTQFEQHPEWIGFWQQETLKDQTGTRYYRRITMQPTCLACHGKKDSRPEFVKANYPQDLAYDFNSGDLRGMYAVFIPDAMQQALNATAE